MATLLTDDAALQLGLGWYSVEFDDAPRKARVSTRTALAFLRETAESHGDDTAFTGFPVASVVRELDAAPKAERAAWLTKMCGAARSELESR